MLSKFCSSDWQPKTSHPCRDGHSHAIQSASNNSKNQAMCLAALLPHANADPTPLHNINTHSAIHAPIPLDWFWFSTSTDVSSCHKDAISRCSQARACRFTACCHGFYDSFSYCSFISFHPDMSLRSLFLLSLSCLKRILAAVCKV